MIKRKSNFVYATHQGFSLIELMVAMAIGLFLIAGVFSVYVNGRHSQNTVDEQVGMVDNARFALETIAADIRQSGVVGRTKERGKILDPVLPGISGECTPGWVYASSATTPMLQVFDGTAAGGANPYPATCTADYLANTPESDVIEMRYSMMAPVKDTALLSNVVYVQGNVDEDQVFYGSTTPNPLVTDSNYMFVANLYYIAANGDPGDGIPSLHRAALQPGGVVDQVLLTGVENMQIQLGIDSNGDQLVDKYVDSGAAGSVDWKTVKTIQIWLVIRSLNVDMSVNTVIKPNIAGVPVQLPADGVNDGVRRMVVSTVALLRNGP